MKFFLSRVLIGVMILGGLLFILAGCVPYQPPVAAFSIEPPGGEGYVPFTVNFNGSGSYSPDGFIESYQWDFGDSHWGQGATTSHTYQDEGQYQATLTVTDNRGQQDQASVPIKVWNPSPKPDFTFWPENPELDQEVTFDASLSIDPGSKPQDIESEQEKLEPKYITNFWWDFGDGSKGRGETTTHAYSESGTYSVTLTVGDDDYATSSITKEIIVSKRANKDPKAKFSYQVGEIVCTAAIIPVQCSVQVLFDASRSWDLDGTIINYHWDYGDGEEKDSNPTVKHWYYYKKGISYTATLTVTDNDGATAWVSKTITFNQESCIPEGESGAVTPWEKNCCPGLNRIGCESPDQDGNCQPCLGAFICAKCPNRECGPGENKCNCPQDCQQIQIKTFPGAEQETIQAKTLFGSFLLQNQY